MLLLDDLLINIPLNIGKKVLGEIKNQVDHQIGQFDNPEEVINEIKKLQVSLETGEITEDEYDKMEEELFDVLEEMKDERDEDFAAN